MENVINLRQKRKVKARKDKATKAHENRVKFGRTKEQKEASLRAEQKQSQFFKNHLLLKKDAPDTPPSD